MPGKICYQPSCILIGAMVLLANALIAFCAIGMGNDALHAENSILENAQAACLSVAAIGYLLGGSDSRHQRLIQLGLALLSFSFLLRELDLDELNVPKAIQLLGSGRGRVILLVCLWAALGYYFAKGLETPRQFGRQFLGSQQFALLAAAFCLLVLSAAMDKNVFHMTHARLFEELLEANAYLLIIIPLLSKRMRIVDRVLFSVPADPS